MEESKSYRSSPDMMTLFRTLKKIQEEEQVQVVSETTTPKRRRDDSSRDDEPTSGEAKRQRAGKQPATTAAIGKTSTRSSSQPKGSKSTSKSASISTPVEASTAEERKFKMGANAKEVSPNPYGDIQFP